MIGWGHGPLTFETTSAGCTTDGISGGVAFDIVASGNGETICGLQIVDADVVHGDVLDFRLTRDGGVLLNTYAVTPSLTVSDADPQTLVAGTLTVTFTAPTATRLATRTLVAGQPTVTVTAPAAMLIAGGPQTLTAGTPVFTMTAPTATRSAVVSLLSGSPPVTVTSPQAMLIIESVSTLFNGLTTSRMLTGIG